MAQEKTIEMSVDISAPASKVWKALIEPEWTKKYMFGCEAISDWKIGSRSSGKVQPMELPMS